MTPDEFWETYGKGRRTYWNQRVADQLERQEHDPDDIYDVPDDTTHGGSLLDPEVVGKDANLVSSQGNGTDMHKPCLDIDVKCLRVDSSTPGHCHLYFDHEVEWASYKKLLLALAECGIADPRWVEHSIERHQTMLRPPGVTKMSLAEAEQRAIAAVIDYELEHPDGLPKRPEKTFLIGTGTYTIEVDGETKTYTHSGKPVPDTDKF